MSDNLWDNLQATVGCRSMTAERRDELSRLAMRIVRLFVHEHSAGRRVSTNQIKDAGGHNYKARVSEIRKIMGGKESIRIVEWSEGGKLNWYWMDEWKRMAELLEQLDAEKGEAA